MPIETLTPELTEGEKEIVEERTALRAAVVHEAIREQGETELRRPVLALTWSGLAAGLTMGCSMISQGLLQSHLPDAPWRPLITNLGYSVGFLGVILGRQQLFTENTLTVILPLLARRHGTTLLGVGRLWSIVLVANLIGALAIAWVIGNTGIFTPNVRGAFSMIGAAALSGGPSTIFLRGIFAGWLIALTVWMLPAAEGSRPVIIIAMTYLVGSACYVIACGSALCRSHQRCRNLDRVFPKLSASGSRRKYSWRRVIGCAVQPCPSCHRTEQLSNAQRLRNPKLYDRDQIPRPLRIGTIRYANRMEVLNRPASCKRGVARSAAVSPRGSRRSSAICVVRAGCPGGRSGSKTSYRKRCTILVQ